MYSIARLAVSLALAVTAVTAAPYSYPYCSSQLLTFDDLPPNVASPDLSPIGTYKGLVFKAFGVSTAYGGTTDGVIPQSQANVAAASATTDTETFTTVTLNPFGTFSAQKGVFNLYSLYIGCGFAATSSGVPGTAIGCVLSFVGLDSKGNEIASQTASFSPTNQAAAKMTVVQFGPAFTGVSSVVVGIAAGLLPDAQILFLDNIYVSECS